MPKTAGLDHENALWSQGFQRVIGLDEVGRGAWAGPVMAGAVCLPSGQPEELVHLLEGVRDSKQLSARARTRLIDTIKQTAITWGVGAASADEIALLGIVPATTLAMSRALQEAQQRVAGFAWDFIISDSIRWPEQQQNPTFKSIINGDRLSLTIAAASILAKVTRDRYMLDLHRDPAYTPYSFNTHKGYGTPKHRAALRLYGVSAAHRRVFEPMKSMLSEAS
jgi:ribonuclease HII